MHWERKGVPSRIICVLCEEGKGKKVEMEVEQSEAVEQKQEIQKAEVQVSEQGDVVTSQLQIFKSVRVQQIFKSVCAQQIAVTQSKTVSVKIHL